MLRSVSVRVITIPASVLTARCLNHFFLGKMVPASPVAALYSSRFCFLIAMPVGASVAGESVGAPRLLPRRPPIIAIVAQQTSAAAGHEESDVTAGGFLGNVSRITTLEPKRRLSAVSQQSDIRSDYTLSHSRQSRNQYCALPRELM